jgi:hypothetical protein
MVTSSGNSVAGAMSGGRDVDAQEDSNRQIPADNNQTKAARSFELTPEHWAAWLARQELFANSHLPPPSDFG